MLAPAYMFLNIRKNVFVFYCRKFTAFADKVKRNCYFLVPGLNFVTHRQALQGFLDTIQVSLYRINKINSP